MNYFTGIQHTKSGDIVMPILGYETRDGYLTKYHQEMAYAMANNNFIGLTIKVFDVSGRDVLFDNWIREAEND